MDFPFQSYDLLDYYLTSVLAGILSLLSPHFRDAAARILNPLSYPRYMEYRLVFDQLGPLNQCRVLDIGSPKLPVLLLARDDRCQLYSTDIRDYFIGSTSLFLTRIGLGHRLGKSIHLEVRDARQLLYPDECFDRAFSISVLEHVPGNGDKQAAREIARVLRPGGILMLTVPFAANGYRDEFVHGDIYERPAVDGGTFYQRHYDLPALYERLIAPSGLDLAEMTFFGEPGIRFESFWNRVPMQWKIPLLWAQPFLAQLFLKTVDMSRLDAATGVALKLVKPA
jgi:SAM-dependent methyltransferase